MVPNIPEAVHSVADPGLMKGVFSGDTKILARGCSQWKMGQLC